MYVFIHTHTSNEPDQEGCCRGVLASATSTAPFWGGSGVSLFCSVNASPAATAGPFWFDKVACLEVASVLFASARFPAGCLLVGSCFSVAGVWLKPTCAITCGLALLGPYTPDSPSGDANWSGLFRHLHRPEKHPLFLLASPSPTFPLAVQVGEDILKLLPTHSSGKSCRHQHLFTVLQAADIAAVLALIAFSQSSILWHLSFTLLTITAAASLAQTSEHVRGSHVYIYIHIGSVPKKKSKHTPFYCLVPTKNQKTPLSPQKSKELFDENRKQCAQRKTRE